MVSVIMLCFELLLDAIGLVAGIIVFIRSSGNSIQRSWGMLAIFLSLLLLYDNTEWIWLFNKDVQRMPLFTEVPLNHLSLWHIVRTVVFFQLFSIFPIASLKPGWMNLTRILNLCIPILLIICIACCYELFNGQYTILKSFADIKQNITRQDVAMRLILFIVSVVAPSINFLFPYLRQWLPVRRKQSRGMTTYMVCFGLIMSGYIWLMLGTSGLSFNLFGYFVILPTIYLNILYIYNGDPLSLPPLPVENLQSEEIEAIKEALHYDGFSGFRDYINFHRLQYFKEQAMEKKELTVKELMFKSGFTSRSSFYRYFSNIEKMSPSEYMEMLQKENKAVST